MSSPAGFSEVDPFTQQSSPASSGADPHEDRQDPPSPAPEPASPPPRSPDRQQASSSSTAAAAPAQPDEPSDQAPYSRAYNLQQAEYAQASIARYLQGETFTIEIIDAYKTQEGSSSVYIVYVVRTGTVESRRRYSEFESLRLNLSKLYPTLIVPPIPSKTTVTEYAVKQNKAKEDAALIARRTRMLGTFLNRVARHPILGQDAVFHKFLDGGVSWPEILHSPPLSLLPKNNLRAPAHDPTDHSASAAYASLPVPSAAQPLRQPDQRFLESEAFTNKFEKHLSGSMEKVNRRVLKRWSEDAHDYAELGAVLNGFSLTETGSLSTAIEKTGQAVDATYLSTTNLLSHWEAEFTEPLTDYAHFGAILKKLLLYRHQKHLQYELTLDQIEIKKEYLAQLEKSEDEARRLDGALAAAGIPGRRRANDEGEGEGSDGAAAASQAGLGASRSGQSLASSSSAGGLRKSPSSGSSGGGYGFLSALSHSLTGMMDGDPEATRRSNISKTRDTISQLEDALHHVRQDLRHASQTIQADLDRFQRQKVADVRDMCLALATAHRDWCRQNLAAWLEAKAAVEAIEPHPNQSPLPPVSRPPPARRPSAASATSTASRPPAHLASPGLGLQ